MRTEQTRSFYDKMYQDLLDEIENKLESKDTAVKKIEYLKLLGHELERKKDKCNQKSTPHIIPSIFFAKNEDVSPPRWDYYFEYDKSKTELEKSEYDLFESKYERLICEVMVYFTIAEDFIKPQLNYFQSEYSGFVAHITPNINNGSNKNIQLEPLSWKENTTLLVYLFIELERTGLVDKFSPQWISQTFRDKKGKAMNNKQISAIKAQIKSNKKTQGKPTRSNVVDEVVDQNKAKKKLNIT